MTPTETQELIQLAADDALSDAQKGELERLVSESPEVRAEMDAVAAVVRQLEDAAAVDAPGDLRERILHEMRERRQQARPAGDAGRFGARARLVLAGGWLAAAAILATVILVPAFRSSVETASPGSVSGAMTRRPWASVSTSEGGVGVEAVRSGDELRVMIAGASGEVRVSWDSGALEPLGDSRAAGAASEMVIECSGGRCPMIRVRHVRSTTMRITAESRPPFTLEIPSP